MVFLERPHLGFESHFGWILFSDDEWITVIANSEIQISMIALPTEKKRIPLNCTISTIRSVSTKVIFCYLPECLCFAHLRLPSFPFLRKNFLSNG